MLYEGKTYEEYLELVKEKGIYLEYVPDKYKTYDLCFEAVKSVGSSLVYVPDKHRTYELCLQAVENNKISANILPLIPNKHRTYELCLETLKQCKIREGKELYFNYYIPDNIIKEISEKNDEFKSISQDK